MLCMASLHKQPGKPNWFCAFNKRDGEGNLRRCFRSTGTPDKKQATQICRAWANASLYGEKLNADKAREIIAAGVADVLAASGDSLPSATIRDWSKRWLEFKAVEAEPRTHERYEVSVRRFLAFMGTKGEKDLNTLRADDIVRFRDDTAERLSVASTNMDLKVLRSCLYAAVKQDLLNRNVAAQVDTLRQRGENKRRAFTLVEVQKVVKRCEQCGGEWRGLVLTAVYTGQRLGDVAALTWQQVDLESRQIAFVTQKTGKRLAMAMAKPLAEYFESLPATDDPAAFVFPNAAAAAEKHTGTLSTKFYDEILAPAGLVPVRPRKDISTGKGRDAKRTQSELSFHSFRHTLTTWLKSAGASNALAQMIVGHDSEVVSRGYTHLNANDTAKSIAKLPDVTK
jgi:integrase